MLILNYETCINNKLNGKGVKCLILNSIYNCTNFSLLVGQGAHEFATANNIIAVDPFNLISGW